MSDVVHVDDNNFEVEVLSSSVPVLVDLSAVWCGPCARQLPLLEKFASENVGKIKVCKIDIDDAPRITAKLGVRSVPTLMVFNEGKSLGSKVGLTTLAQMTDLVLTKIAI
jgi:thioredoxin 1